MLLVLLLVVAGAAAQQAQSKGEVWPKARFEQKQKDVFSIDINKVLFKVGEKCDNLTDKALARLKYNVNVLQNIVKNYRNSKVEHVRLYDTMQNFDVHIEQPCAEEYPFHGMDESYNLTVNSNLTVLRANTVWGFLRGFETFSHLAYITDDYKDVVIQSTVISDYPYYLHRGLLLDTSRHFLSVDKILASLDAMAMNKMNVLHWHIVDDESFPFESQTHPELSAKGAYDPHMTYTKSDMETIRDHARDLGIRVMMELDMPGHVRSWGKSHPELLTECNGLGPMNPIKTETYKFIGEVLKDVQDLFPESFYHIGGDEVPQSCWSNNAEIQKYMKDHDMTTNQLFEFFIHGLTQRLRKGTTTMVWREVYEAGVSLSNDTIVQVWGSHNFQPLMAQILKSGHRGVLSSSFYLNFVGKFFGELYLYEPRLQVKPELNGTDVALLDNLIGGEACMWGEMVDDNNVLSRVWPRASAVAEVLWSVTHGAIDEDVYRRGEEHTCRMVRRGIPAQPAHAPGYCVK